MWLHPVTGVSPAEREEHSEERACGQRRWERSLEDLSIDYFVPGEATNVRNRTFLRRKKKMNNSSLSPNPERGEQKQGAERSESPTTSRVRLSDFQTAGYDKGRNKIQQALWFACQKTLFEKWWLPPKVRPIVLRKFGAEIGDRVFIRHGVRIHWPWKLEIGDDCWIGEGAWILNLEKITIGNNVCISQEALLCTGSHDAQSEIFAYDNGPIEVRDGTWIGARSTLLRGVVIGPNALASAGSIVTKNVPEDSIVRGFNSISGKRWV